MFVKQPSACRYLQDLCFPPQLLNAVGRRTAQRRKQLQGTLNGVRVSSHDMLILADRPE